MPELRIEKQCPNCSCYYENWEDPELETDHECSLEYNIYDDAPCEDCDIIGE